MLIVRDLQSQKTHWILRRNGLHGKWRAKPGTVIMKFGEQLRASMMPEYQWYYIDYEGLKRKLKAGTAIAGPGQIKWSEQDEHDFLRAMEDELDKVYTKERVRASEIQRRIQIEEADVKSLVKRMDERGPNDAGPSEEEFIDLEVSLHNVICDVNDLSKFVQLNYTGFKKIVKKHDKLTNWQLKPLFQARLSTKPFWKENYDRDLVNLSRLLNQVRTRGNPVKGDSSAGGSQANFVRQTTKYWVHPENVTELKLIILKYLPLLVFNANKEFEPADAAISSIYYDNVDTWELYNGRLKKTEGAEAIRLRWYGGMQTDTVFVERKTHREDWTGEQSVKARFSTKEKNINAYMKGHLLPVAMFEKARKEGKRSAKQISEDERLATEVQYSVLKKGYKPVCRSFYNRTAFQLPGDARVRISLDTELTMIREDNLDGVERCGDNWRRMDIGIDYPFSQLPAKDIVRFPYAVLEVKLQTQNGQQPPEWVRQLISSHLVEAVPKFSKFIHGTATLFPTSIKLLPYWMPQMDVDIRKPVTHNFGIRRIGRHGTGGVPSDTDPDDDDDDDSDDDQEGASSQGRSSRSNQDSLSRAARTLGITDIEDQTIAVVPTDPDYPLYDSDDEYDSEDALEEAKRVGGWTYFAARVKQVVKGASLGARKVATALLTHPRGSMVPLSNREQMFFGSQQTEMKKFKAPKGKRIYVPVRVEPKVYFAAERTFLGWLEFSIYVGTIAVTLLNFGTVPTAASLVVSGLFTLLAILSLSYSVAIYLYRRNSIRQRRASKYYAKYGPTVLCLALFLAILINFAHEGRNRDLW